MLSAVVAIFALTTSSLLGRCECRATGDFLERRASEQGHSQSGSGSHSTEASNAGHSSIDSHGASGQDSSCGHGIGSGSGHGGDHEHHQWWQDDYEYEHFEGVVIIALVLTTLVFDEIHHRVEETAEEFGHAALLQHFVHDVKISHTRNLWVHLHQRCSGELSVLGFLALLVWCCNQFGLFDKLAESEVRWGIMLPPTGTDYLHTVENVHIHLFIAMIFYFCFLSVLVAIATRLVEKSVHANDMIQKAYCDGTITDGDELEYLVGKDTFLRKFFLLRKYYFMSLEKWRGSWCFFDEHLKGFQKDLVRYATECDTNLAESGEYMSMAVMLQRWFPFDLYVVVNYRHTMDDMIEVHWSTWLIICALLLVQTIIQRAAKQDLQMNIVWITVGQCIIAVVICVTRYSFSVAVKRTKEAVGHSGILSHAWVHRVRPVVLVARTVQVCAFFTMFEFASTIASKSEWQNHPTSTLIFCFLLLFGIAGEGLLLGIALPIYSVLIATGPYMQEKHVVRLQLIVKACARSSSPAKLRELADGGEAFDEVADEVEEKSRTHNAPPPRSQRKSMCWCLPGRKHGKGMSNKKVANIDTSAIVPATPADPDT